MWMNKMDDVDADEEWSDDEYSRARKAGPEMNQDEAIPTRSTTPKNVMDSELSDPITLILNKIDAELSAMKDRDMKISAAAPSHLDRRYQVNSLGSGSLSQELSISGDNRRTLTIKGSPENGPESTKSKQSDPSDDPNAQGVFESRRELNEIAHSDDDPDRKSTSGAPRDLDPFSAQEIDRKFKEIMLRKRGKATSPLSARFNTWTNSRPPTTSLGAGYGTDSESVLTEDFETKFMGMMVQPSDIDLRPHQTATTNSSVAGTPERSPRDTELKGPEIRTKPKSIMTIKPRSVSPTRTSFPRGSTTNTLTTGDHVSTTQQLQKHQNQLFSWDDVFWKNTSQKSPRSIVSTASTFEEVESLCLSRVSKDSMDSSQRQWDGVSRSGRRDSSRSRVSPSKRVTSSAVGSSPGSRHAGLGFDYPAINAQTSQGQSISNKLLESLELIHSRGNLDLTGRVYLETLLQRVLSHEGQHHVTPEASGPSSSSLNSNLRTRNQVYQTPREISAGGLSPLQTLHGLANTPDNGNYISHSSHQNNSQLESAASPKNKSTEKKRRRDLILPDGDDTSNGENSKPGQGGHTYSTRRVSHSSSDGTLSSKVLSTDSQSKLSLSSSGTDNQVARDTNQFNALAPQAYNPNLAAYLPASTFIHRGSFERTVTPPDPYVFNQPYTASHAERVLMGLGFSSTEGFLPERFLRDWYDKITKAQLAAIEEMKEKDSFDNLPEQFSRQVSRRPSLSNSGDFVRQHSHLSMHNRSESPVLNKAVTNLLPSGRQSSKTELLNEYISSFYKNPSPGESDQDRRVKQFATSRQNSLPLFLETFSRAGNGKKLRIDGPDDDDSESRLEFFLSEFLSEKNKSDKSQVLANTTESESDSVGSFSEKHTHSRDRSHSERTHIYKDTNIDQAATRKSRDTSKQRKDIFNNNNEQHKGSKTQVNEDTSGKSPHHTRDNKQALIFQGDVSSKSSRVYSSTAPNVYFSSCPEGYSQHQKVSPVRQEAIDSSLNVSQEEVTSRNLTQEVTITPDADPSVGCSEYTTLRSTVAMTQRMPDKIESAQSIDGLEVAAIMAHPTTEEQVKQEDSNTSKCNSKNPALKQVEPAMVSIILEDVDQDQDGSSFDYPSGSSEGSRLGIPSSRRSSVSLSPIPQSPATVIEVCLDNQQDSLDTEETGSSKDTDEDSGCVDSTDPLLGEPKAPNGRDSKRRCLSHQGHCVKRASSSSSCSMSRRQGSEGYVDSLEVPMPRRMSLEVPMLPELRQVLDRQKGLKIHYLQKSSSNNEVNGRISRSLSSGASVDGNDELLKTRTHSLDSGRIVALTPENSSTSNQNQPMQYKSSTQNNEIANNEVNNYPKSTSDLPIFSEEGGSRTQDISRPKSIYESRHFDQLTTEDPISISKTMPACLSIQNSGIELTLSASVSNESSPQSFKSAFRDARRRPSDNSPVSSAGFWSDTEVDEWSRNVEYANPRLLSSTEISHKTTISNSDNGHNMNSLSAFSCYPTSFSTSDRVKEMNKTSPMIINNFVNARKNPYSMGYDSSLYYYACDRETQCEMPDWISEGTNNASVNYFDKFTQTGIPKFEAACQTADAFMNTENNYEELYSSEYLSQTKAVNTVLCLIGEEHDDEINLADSPVNVESERSISNFKIVDETLQLIDAELLNIRKREFERLPDIPNVNSESPCFHFESPICVTCLKPHNRVTGAATRMADHSRSRVATESRIKRYAPSSWDEATRGAEVASLNLPSRFTDIGNRGAIQSSHPEPQPTQDDGGKSESEICYDHLSKPVVMSMVADHLHPRDKCDKDFGKKHKSADNSKIGISSLHRDPRQEYMKNFINQQTFNKADANHEDIFVNSLNKEPFRTAAGSSKHSEEMINVQEKCRTHVESTPSEKSVTCKANMSELRESGSSENSNYSNTHENIERSQPSTSNREFSRHENWRFPKRKNRDFPKRETYLICDESNDLQRIQSEINDKCITSMCPREGSRALHRSINNNKDQSHAKLSRLRYQSSQRASSSSLEIEADFMTASQFGLPSSELDGAEVSYETTCSADLLDSNREDLTDLQKQASLYSESVKNTSSMGSLYPGHGHPNDLQKQTWAFIEPDKNEAEVEVCQNLSRGNISNYEGQGPFYEDVVESLHQQGQPLTVEVNGGSYNEQAVGEYTTAKLTENSASGLPSANEDITNSSVNNMPSLTQTDTKDQSALRINIPEIIISGAESPKSDCLQIPQSPEHHLKKAEYPCATQMPENAIRGSTERQSPVNPICDGWKVDTEKDSRKKQTMENETENVVLEARLPEYNGITSNMSNAGYINVLLANAENTYSVSEITEDMNLLQAMENIPPGAIDKNIEPNIWMDPAGEFNSGNNMNLKCELSFALHLDNVNIRPLYAFETYPAFFEQDDVDDQFMSTNVPGNSDPQSLDISSNKSIDGSDCTRDLDDIEVLIEEARHTRDNSSNSSYSEPVLDISDSLSDASFLSVGSRRVIGDSSACPVYADSGDASQGFGSELKSRQGDMQAVSSYVYPGSSFSAGSYKDITQMGIKPSNFESSSEEASNDIYGSKEELHDPVDTKSCSVLKDNAISFTTDDVKVSQEKLEVVSAVLQWQDTAGVSDTDNHDKIQTSLQCCNDTDKTYHCLKKMDNDCQLDNTHGNIYIINNEDINTEAGNAMMGTCKRCFGNDILYTESTDDVSGNDILYTESTDDVSGNDILYTESTDDVSTSSKLVRRDSYFTRNGELSRNVAGSVELFKYATDICEIHGVISESDGLCGNVTDSCDILSKDVRKNEQIYENVTEYNQQHKNVTEKDQLCKDGTENDQFYKSVTEHHQLYKNMTEGGQHYKNVAEHSEIDENEAAYGFASSKHRYVCPSPWVDTPMKFTPSFSEVVDIQDQEYSHPVDSATKWSRQTEGDWRNSSVRSGPTGLDNSRLVQKMGLTDSTSDAQRGRVMDTEPKPRIDVESRVLDMTLKADENVDGKGLDTELIRGENVDRVELDKEHTLYEKVVNRVMEIQPKVRIDATSRVTDTEFKPEDNLEGVTLYTEPRNGDSGERVMGIEHILCVNVESRVMEMEPTARKDVTSRVLDIEVKPEDKVGSMVFDTESRKRDFGQGLIGTDHICVNVESEPVAVEQKIYDKDETNETETELRSCGSNNSKTYEDNEKGIDLTYAEAASRSISEKNATDTTKSVSNLPPHERPTHTRISKAEYIARYFPSIATMEQTSNADDGSVLDNGDNNTSYQYWQASSDSSSTTFPLSEISEEETQQEDSASEGSSGKEWEESKRFAALPCESGKDASFDSGSGISARGRFEYSPRFWQASVTGASFELRNNSPVVMQRVVNQSCSKMLDTWSDNGSNSTSFDQVGVFGTDSQMLSEKPQLPCTDSKTVAQQPQLPGTLRKMPPEKLDVLGTESKIFSEQLDVLDKESNIFSERLDVLGKESNIFSEQLDVLGTDSNMFCEQPELLGADSSVYSERLDKMMVSKRPNAPRTNIMTLAKHCDAPDADIMFSENFDICDFQNPLSSPRIQSFIFNNHKFATPHDVPDDRTSYKSNRGETQHHVPSADMINSPVNGQITHSLVKGQTTGLLNNGQMTDSPEDGEITQLVTDSQYNEEITVSQIKGGIHDSLANRQTPYSADKGKITDPIISGEMTDAQDNGRKNDLLVNRETIESLVNGETTVSLDSRKINDSLFNGEITDYLDIRQITESHLQETMHASLDNKGIIYLPGNCRKRNELVYNVPATSFVTVPSGNSSQTTRTVERECDTFGTTTNKISDSYTRRITYYNSAHGVHQTMDTKRLPEYSLNNNRYRSSATFSVSDYNKHNSTLSTVSTGGFSPFESGEYEAVVAAGKTPLEGNTIPESILNHEAKLPKIHDRDNQESAFQHVRQEHEITSPELMTILGSQTHKVNDSGDSQACGFSYNGHAYTVTAHEDNERSNEESEIKGNRNDKCGTYSRDSVRLNTCCQSSVATDFHRGGNQNSEGSDVCAIGDSDNLVCYSGDDCFNDETAVFGYGVLGKFYTNATNGDLRKSLADDDNGALKYGDFEKPVEGVFNIDISRYVPDHVGAFKRDILSTYFTTDSNDTLEKSLSSDTVIFNSGDRDTSFTRDSNGDLKNKDFNGNNNNDSNRLLLTDICICNNVNVNDSCTENDNGDLSNSIRGETGICRNGDMSISSKGERIIYSNGDLDILPKGELEVSSKGIFPKVASGDNGVLFNDGASNITGRDTGINNHRGNINEGNVKSSHKLIINKKEQEMFTDKLILNEKENLNSREKLIINEEKHASSSDKLSIKDVKDNKSNKTSKDKRRQYLRERFRFLLIRNSNSDEETKYDSDKTLGGNDDINTQVDYLMTGSVAHTVVPPSTPGSIQGKMSHPTGGSLSQADNVSHPTAGFLSQTDNVSHPIIGPVSQAGKTSPPIAGCVSQTSKVFPLIDGFLSETDQRGHRIACSVPQTTNPPPPRAVAVSESTNRLPQMGYSALNTDIKKQIRSRCLLNGSSDDNDMTTHVLTFEDEASTKRAAVAFSKMESGDNTTTDMIFSNDSQMDTRNRNSKCNSNTINSRQLEENETVINNGDERSLKQVFNYDIDNTENIPSTFKLTKMEPDLSTKRNVTVNTMFSRSKGRLPRSLTITDNSARGRLQQDLADEDQTYVQSDCIQDFYEQTSPSVRQITTTSDDGERIEGRIKLVQDLRSEHTEYVLPGGIHKSLVQTLPGDERILANSNDGTDVRMKLSQDMTNGNQECVHPDGFHRFLKQTILTSISADGTHSVTRSTNGAHSVTNSTDGAHSVTNPTYGAHNVISSTHGAHSVTNPTHGAHSVTNPTDGTHSVTNPTHGAHSVTNLTHGAHSVTNLTHGAHNVTNPTHGALSVTNPTHGVHSVTNPPVYDFTNQSQECNASNDILLSNAHTASENQNGMYAGDLEINSFMEPEYTFAYGDQKYTSPAGILNIQAQNSCENERGVSMNRVDGNSLSKFDEYFTSESQECYSPGGIPKSSTEISLETEYGISDSSSGQGSSGRLVKLRSVDFHPSLHQLIDVSSMASDNEDDDILNAFRIDSCYDVRLLDLAAGRCDSTESEEGQFGKHLDNYGHGGYSRIGANAPKAYFKTPVGNDYERNITAKSKDVSNRSTDNRYKEAEPGGLADTKDLFAAKCNIKEWRPEMKDHVHGASFLGCSFDKSMREQHETDRSIEGECSDNQMSRSEISHSHMTPGNYQQLLAEHLKEQKNSFSEDNQSPIENQTSNCTISTSFEILVRAKEDCIPELSYLIIPTAGSQERRCPAMSSRRSPNIAIIVSSPDTSEVESRSINAGNDVEDLIIYQDSLSERAHHDQQDLLVAARPGLVENVDFIVSKDEDSVLNSEDLDSCPSEERIHNSLDIVVSRKRHNTLDLSTTHQENTFNGEKLESFIPQESATKLKESSLRRVSNISDTSDDQPLSRLFLNLANNQSISHQRIDSPSGDNLDDLIPQELDDVTTEELDAIITNEFDDLGTAEKLDVINSQELDNEIDSIIDDLRAQTRVSLSRHELNTVSPNRITRTGLPKEDNTLKLSTSTNRDRLCFEDTNLRDNQASETGHAINANQLFTTVDDIDQSKVTNNWESLYTKSLSVASRDSGFESHGSQVDVTCKVTEPRYSTFTDPNAESDKKNVVIFNTNDDVPERNVDKEPVRIEVEVQTQRRARSVSPSGPSRGSLDPILKDSRSNPHRSPASRTEERYRNKNHTEANLRRALRTSSPPASRTDFYNISDSEINTYQQALHLMRKKLVEAQEDVRSAREMADRAKSELLALEFKRGNLIQELERVNNDVTRKKTQLSVLDSEMTTKTEEAKNLRSLGLTWEDVNALKEENVSLKQKLRTTEGLHMERDELVRQLEATKEDLFREQKHARAKLDEQQEEMENLAAKLEETEQSWTSDQAQLVKLETSLKKLEREKNELLQEQIKQQEEMKASLQDANSETESRLKKELGDLDREVQELKVKINNLQLENVMKDALAEKLRSEVNEMGSMIDRERQEKHKISADQKKVLENLKKETATAVLRIKESMFLDKQKALEELKKQLEEEKREAAARQDGRLMQILENHTYQMEEKAAHISRLEEAIRRMESSRQMEMEEQIIDSVQREREKVANEKDLQLREEREEATRKNNELMIALDKEKQANRDLLREVTGLKKELEEQRKQQRDTSKEKLMAVTRAKNQMKEQWSAESERIKFDLKQEHESETSNLKEIIHSQEQELNRFRLEVECISDRERQAVKTMDQAERMMAAEISKVCQRLANLTGAPARTPPSISTNADMGDERPGPPFKNKPALNAALANLHACIEDLQYDISEMQQEHESLTAVIRTISKEKDEAIENCRLEMDRQRIADLEKLKEKLLKNHVTEMSNVIKECAEANSQLKTNSEIMQRYGDAALLEALQAKDDELRTLQVTLEKWQGEMEEKFNTQLQLQIAKEREKYQALQHHSTREQKRISDLQKREIDRLEKELHKISTPQDSNRYAPPTSFAHPESSLPLPSPPPPPLSSSSSPLLPTPAANIKSSQQYLQNRIEQLQVENDALRKQRMMNSSRWSWSTSNLAKLPSQRSLSPFGRSLSPSPGMEATQRLGERMKQNDAETQKSGDRVRRNQKLMNNKMEEMAKLQNTLMLQNEELQALERSYNDLQKHCLPRPSPPVRILNTTM